MTGGPAAALGALWLRAGRHGSASSISLWLLWLLLLLLLSCSGFLVAALRSGYILCYCSFSCLSLKTVMRSSGPVGMVHALKL